MLMPVLYLIGSFLAMEAASWTIHKYIMHGALWHIHRTHHEHNKGFFELNDVFSLFFGTVAVVLILSDLANTGGRFWIGMGISLYGVVYFILHDVLIHKRIKFKGRPIGVYLNGISKAHRDHHKSKEKDDSVCFGLLVVPKKYFKSKGE